MLSLQNYSAFLVDYVKLLACFFSYELCVKTYVQDLIRKNADEVFDVMVKRGGHFYVCGDVQMASDVTETLSKIVQEIAKMSNVETQSFMLKLKVNVQTLISFI